MVASSSSSSSRIFLFFFFFVYGFGLLRVRTFARSFTSLHLRYARPLKMRSFALFALALANADQTRWTTMMMIVVVTAPAVVVVVVVVVYFNDSVFNANISETRKERRKEKMRDATMTKYPESEKERSQIFSSISTEPIMVQYENDCVWLTEKTTTTGGENELHELFLVPCQSRSFDRATKEKKKKKKKNLASMCAPSSRPFS